MNYWIFTVTKHKLERESYTAEEIYNQRMQDKFWGLGENTPNRKNLKIGDKVVFYKGLPDKAFAGEATLASDSFQLSDNQKQEYGHGKEYYEADYGVLIS